jgi:DNA ligase-4
LIQHEDGFDSTISIAALDELLDELAAKSGYSHKSLHSKYSKEHSRPRSAILRTLFRLLSPEDASVLVQIILKDLRPLMYPLTEFHYTTALTRFNASSVKMLIKEHAMDVWDPSRLLSSFYRMRSSLDEAAAFADNPPSSASRWSDIRPTIASPVAVSSIQVLTSLSTPNSVSSADSQIRKSSGMCTRPRILPGFK